MRNEIQDITLAFLKSPDSASESSAEIAALCFCFFGFISLMVSCMFCSIRVIFQLFQRYFLGFIILLPATLHQACIFAWGYGNPSSGPSTWPHRIDLCPLIQPLNKGLLKVNFLEFKLLRENS